MKLDYDFILKIIPDIIHYIPVTLKLTLVSFLFAFPLGTLIALILYRRVKVLHPICRVFLSLIRGTPAVLQIYIIYNLMPYVVATYLNAIGSTINVYKINNIYYAFIALSLPPIVSIADAVRAGLETVNKGEYEAALSIGMKESTAFIRIILPQALTVGMPVITTAIVNLMQSTSLAFMMTVTDIMGRAKILAGKELRFFEAYLVVFMIYIVLVSVTEYFLQCFEKHISEYRRGRHNLA